MDDNTQVSAVSDAADGPAVTPPCGQLTVAVSTGGLQLITRKAVSGRPFKPGQSGNPAGRKPGSRNKLSELFVAAMREDFAEHGRAAIAALRERDPATYLAAVRSMIPAHIVAESAEKSTATDHDCMSDAEWAEAMDSGGNPRDRATRDAQRSKAVELVLDGRATSVGEAMRMLGADF